MKEKATNELDEMLKHIEPDKLKHYYQQNNEYIANAEKAFTYYMKDVIDKKNLIINDHKLQYKDIYSFAGVSEKYGEKILNMEKHTKDRDLIIRFCIIAHFQLHEINTALKLYGMRPLYAKDRRDACMIVAVNNRIYDLCEIDEMLEAQGFIRLSKNIWV